MPSHNAAHEFGTDSNDLGTQTQPNIDNILPVATTFQDKLKHRKEAFKHMPHVPIHQSMDDLRQEARQKAMRNIELNRRRIPEYNISTPPPSPKVVPKLEARYDERLATAKRNPQIQRPQTAGPPSRLERSRAGALMIPGPQESMQARYNERMLKREAKRYPKVYRP